jgi:hypothetical protein
MLANSKQDINIKTAPKELMDRNALSKLSNVNYKRRDKGARKRKRANAKEKNDAK